MKPIQSTPIQSILLLWMFLLLCSLQAPAQGLINDYQQFNTAYNERNYAECVRLGAPLAKATDHPGIQYKLAECYCQTGQLAQGLDLLGMLANRGLPYKVADNVAFGPLIGNARYAGYTAAFLKNQAVLNKSGISFAINDSLLIPEGMAYGSQQQTFYVGSLAKHKVLRCSGNGSCSDFADGKEHGFWMALGMKVSANAKSLWLCSASETGSLDGYSGLFQFEIPSGKLLRKFVIDNKQGPHLFNDLVLTASGAVYFTDSKGGKLWCVLPGSDTLTEYAADLVYPNGIAWDEEKKALFVADFMGLHVFDLATGKRAKLDHQGNTYLNGIDGLYYYKGSLIGIQDSGNQDDRVVRFYYDLTKNMITRTVTLQTFRPDFIIPTTGTIVDGYIHYIANAQLRSLQPDGSITNPEKLVKPVILKLKLD